MNATNTKQLTVVLNMPKKVAELIICANTIYNSMNGNANFPNSAATLAKLKADNDALTKAESGLNASPATSTVAKRDMPLSDVKAGLRALVLDVQIVANKNLLTARTVIESAGMSVKGASNRDKRQNSVGDGDEPGSVNIFGEGKGVHQWQASTDKGDTIIELAPTLSGQTVATGLEIGKMYSFRNRQVLRNDKYGVWSMWMDITVR